MAATLDQVQRVLEDPSPLLAAIGITAAGYFQKAFDRQSWGGDPWPQRYPFQRTPKVNIAGVLADLNAGRTPAARRFEDWPVLKDSGDLMNSIVPQIVGESTVEIGSNLDYADTQNVGGPSGQPVTPQAKRGIVAMIERQPDLATNLGGLLNEDIHITDVIGRQFIGMNDELDGLLGKAVVEAVESA